MGQERKISKYEEFAQELESQIHSGTFPVGGRIPSIRESSASESSASPRCSQAYQLLENRGIIEARPQSGYYVNRARPENRAPEPDFQPIQGDPTSVSIDEVSLGSSTTRSTSTTPNSAPPSPDPTLLPTAKLNRILADLAREGRFSHGLGERGAGQRGPQDPGCPARLQLWLRHRARGHRHHCRLHRSHEPLPPGGLRARGPGGDRIAHLLRHPPGAGGLPPAGLGDPVPPAHAA